MAYDFDQSFQRRLLAAAWENPQWVKSNGEVMRAGFFTDEVTAGVAACILEHIAERGDSPDLAGVIQESRSRCAPGRTQGEYEEEARRIHKLIGRNGDYYRDKALAFARRQAMVEAVGEAHQLIEAGELDKIQALIDRASKVGAGALGSYTDYARGWEDRLKRYRQGRSATGAGRVPSGYAPIDQAMQGGLGPGEVGVILGIAGHGKSTVLRCVGASNLLTGRNVLHVSLENSMEVTEAMYDARFFGRPLDKIRKLPATFRKQMTALTEKLAARLSVVERPSQTVTPSALDAVIAAAPFKPDLVLVDYAALMRPPSKREDYRHELADIFRGVRKVASDARVPIWTAHQSNRPGLGARRIGMEHTAESFEIMGIVDFGMSINYDESREAEVILSVIKNRLGRSGFDVVCEADWSISKVAVPSAGSLE